tara:strand:- start:220 stop:360 length:141 start_codon:yes stop_codon:yes gene_type:complete
MLALLHAHRQFIAMLFQQRMTPRSSASTISAHISYAVISGVQPSTF